MDKVVDLFLNDSSTRKKVGTGSVSGNVLKYIGVKNDNA